MSIDEGPLAIEDEPTSLTTPAAVAAEGIGVPFGRYRLLERIGTGGMAEIYRAVAAGPQGFQRVVAIKRIREAGPQLADIGRLFADEARVSALLDHPNIVQVYDYGAVEGNHYIAMEYLSGRNLDEVLRGLRALGERLSPALAVFIAREVAQGLSYAHSFCDERGRPLEIVHRDVTPANIMLVQAGAVKLLDFGIARVTSELRLTITRGRVIKGKCPYMAPEQITGAKIDGRCDIFALGCVLWEMLTNQRLFQGETELDMMSNVLNSEIPPPSSMAPGVPPVLDLIVARALARDPAARYASADLLAADLEALMRTLPSRHGDLTALLTRLYGRVTPAGLRPVVLDPPDTLREYDVAELDTRSMRKIEAPASMAPPVVPGRPGVLPAGMPRSGATPRSTPIVRPRHRELDDDATTRLLDHGAMARVAGAARTLPAVDSLIGSPRAPTALAVTGAIALAAAIAVALVPMGAGAAARAGGGSPLAGAAAAAGVAGAGKTVAALGSGAARSPALAWPSPTAVRPAAAPAVPAASCQPAAAAVASVAASQVAAPVAGIVAVAAPRASAPATRPAGEGGRVGMPAPAMGGPAAPPPGRALAAAGSRPAAAPPTPPAAAPPPTTVATRTPPGKPAPAAAQGRGSAGGAVKVAGARIKSSWPPRPQAGKPGRSAGARVPRAAYVSGGVGKTAAGGARVRSKQDLALEEAIKESPKPAPPAKTPGRVATDLHVNPFAE